MEEEREFQVRFAMCEYMYSSHVRAVGDHLLTSSKQRTDWLQLKLGRLVLSQLSARVSVRLFTVEFAN